ncbi:MAG: tetratricopeptide repeat protein [Candidatus Riflebacteria bacterium]|nr:tetratricopeptide repeat protein [Candidatus Riflebacteria bacterium]
MLFKKWSSGFYILALALLFIVKPGWGTQGVEKALDEALRSQTTRPVEEVTQKFLIAADQITNPEYKASILALLAEFLMKKQEWARAIEVFKKILAEGATAEEVTAHYSMAQAYLMLNQPEIAKSICAELIANHPNSRMEELANYMKRVSPESVHARLADFFVQTPSVSLSTAPVKAGGIAVATRSEYSKSFIEANLRKNKPAGGKLTTALTATATNELRQPVDEAKIEEIRVAVSGKGWRSGLTGHINSKGMSLRLDNDTDISAQNSLALNGNWKLSEKNQLRLNYIRFGHNGSLTNVATFDSILYNPGDLVQVRTSSFDVGLSRLLNESEHGSWKFLYGMKFSSSFMRLAQKLDSGAGELTQNLSVPYLGVEGNAKLSGNVALNGAVKYFSINQSGASGRLTDFDVALLFGSDYAKEPAETEWYGSLGYRFFLLGGGGDTDSAEIRYSGPTFGLENRF